MTVRAASFVVKDIAFALDDFARFNDSFDFLDDGSAHTHYATVSMSKGTSPGIVG